MAESISGSAQHPKSVELQQLAKDNGIHYDDLIRWLESKPIRDVLIA